MRGDRTSSGALPEDPWVVVHRKVRSPSQHDGRSVRMSFAIPLWGSVVGECCMVGGVCLAGCSKSCPEAMFVRDDMDAALIGPMAEPEAVVTR